MKFVHIQGGTYLNADKIVCMRITCYTSGDTVKYVHWNVEIQADGYGTHHINAQSQEECEEIIKDIQQQCGLSVSESLLQAAMERMVREIAIEDLKKYL